MTFISYAAWMILPTIGKQRRSSGGNASFNNQQHLRQLAASNCVEAAPADCCCVHVSPCAGATVVCLAVLWFQFRHALPAQLQLPQVQPRVMLTDKLGAWVGCIILAVCIVLLAVAPTLGWSLWIVTLVRGQEGVCTRGTDASLSL